MVFLIGAALAAAVLYLWLRGHWFARVLVFLGLLLPGVLVFATPAVWSGFSSMPGSIVPVWVLGGIAAWFVSGLPIYIRRWRFRFIARHYPGALIRLYPQD